MNIRIITLLTFLSVFTACQGQHSKDKNTEPEKKGFEMVQVPSMITDPTERASYLITHYWDKFDFSDTTYMYNPDITEQALSNFIDLTKYVSPETSSAAIKKMMHSAAQDSTMFDYFFRQYEKYLYDPNSPLRNEEDFIYVLEAVMSEPIYNEFYKVRPKTLLEMARKNRPGQIATDFTYTLKDGSKKKLSQLSAPLLLLYFYNPDCEGCKATSEKMISSEFLKTQLKDGKLKLLAFYPDKDIEAWKAHADQFPSEWINSYDANTVVNEEELYDTRAMPTLYLLDKDKKVILKDVTFDQIEAYLSK